MLGPGCGRFCGQAFYITRTVSLKPEKKPNKKPKQTKKPKTKPKPPKKRKLLSGCQADMTRLITGKGYLKRKDAKPCSSTFTAVS